MSAVTIALRAVVFFLVTLMPAAVFAQTAPQRTTATYEDWTLRCETREGTPPQKTCEMVQAVQIQGQGAPISQIAIGRASKGAPLKVVFQVPINVWLPTGVTLISDDKEPTGLAATYKRCLPAACLADTELKDDLVKKLRARTDPGRLEFKDGGQRNVAIPVSFKGFGQALDAMAKE
jgi:invasion protein IalB